MTDAVKAAGTGSKIAMQILHTGRYGYHPWAVSASAKKAPIGWFTPKVRYPFFFFFFFFFYFFFSRLLSRVALQATSARVSGSCRYTR